MTGRRLLVGLITMGLLVPSLLFYLLRLHTFRDYFVIAATCFLAWGVADLVATILSRPRLDNRSPSDALKSWETSQHDEDL